jgi:predicted dehydrogenase
MASRMTRRRFLHESAALAAAAAAAGVLPAADVKKAPPGERVRVGIIGCGKGSQGEYDMNNVVREKFVDVVALCDVHASRADDARKRFPQAKFYQDFRRVIDHTDIDAVVIATPDHMHAIPAVLAMQSGKHVYCEKPLAHSVHEVRVMMETAAKHRRVTQMGTQIHAGDNYRRVVEIVQSGVIGPVRRVQVWCSKRPDLRKLASSPVKVPADLDYDLWLGPAAFRPYDPAFLPFHWRWFWNFGGGILADMACHYMDLPHWALDLRTPTRVSATGKKLSKDNDDEVPDVLQADFHYAARGDQPEVHLTWFSGCPGPDLKATKPFHGYGSGVLFEGDKGQLLADYGRYTPLPKARFKDFTPPKPTIPNSIGHHKEWLEAIRNGGPTTCNFAYSGALAETVLLGNVAFHCGQEIEWDDRAGRVTNVPEADKYLQREYRKGWKLG